MDSNDLALLLEAFLWLVVGSIPLLVGMIGLSCWARNRLHRLQQQELEQTVLQFFDAYVQTGHWPQVRSPVQRKALKVLAQRMDLPAAAVVSSVDATR